MAQYLFVKTRKVSDNLDLLKKIRKVCDLLTPEEIKDTSDNFVGKWNGALSSYYAIQNSKGILGENNSTLIIGWVEEVDEVYKDDINTDVNGSYAVIRNKNNEVSFFCDQFGSRTLWYYLDDEKLIVSTSQRAIVALKGSFNLNEQCISWYLSSGCQGPFISWDKDIVQVLPDFKYVLDTESWSIDIGKKNGMDLPSPGSVKKTEFLSAYENKVKKSLKSLMDRYDNGEILLPISGGLDSRLLLGLCKKQKLDNKIILANWGVEKSEIFDDKKAAKLVANFYEKKIFDKYLPEKINNFDQVIDKFIYMNEGRIDHFNAFTDCFKMWGDFFNNGIRIVVRGDIPYTEGIDLNEIQARSHIGLNLFKDYSNFKDFELDKYIQIQDKYNIAISNDDSLINWRDTLYIRWRVPLVISAFSQQISSYVENRAPMFNWSLFKMYFGLSDCDKGNKKHIEFLCKKNDRSSIPFDAVGSLYSMENYFENISGKKYLIENLNKIKDSKNLSQLLILSLLNKLENIEVKNEIKFSLKDQLKNWLSENMPMLLKAFLKSKQKKTISVTTLSYRLIMIDKIIKMYIHDIEIVTEDKL